MKRHLHITILTAVAALFLHTSGTQAQNITEIAKSDPLIITGSVGTQNTYFHSSAGSAYTAQSAIECAHSELLGAIFQTDAVVGHAHYIG